ncbi:MAG: RNA polymerase sigma factor [Acidobacteriota bacterium]
MPTGKEIKLFEDMMACKEDVFRICLGFSRNASDAEDLSQDVYLKAYQSLGRIHTPYAVREWLFRVARTTCLDHRRRAAVRGLFLRRPAGPDEGLERITPERSAEAGEQLKALKDAVARLPVKLREVFILREYGHLSYQETARTLGIKEGTVMSRLNRARRAVMDRMKENVHG